MLQDPELCSESTLLYLLMSGLHTSINTHISNNFFKEDSDEPYKNSEYFMERVGNHPDRVRNLHFIYATVVRAVTLIEPALLNQDFVTGIDKAEDAQTRQLVRSMIRNINNKS